MKNGCVPKQPSKDEPHAVIAGALFDFMGWLTSRPKRIMLSSADDASPAVDAIKDFAKMRGLSLDDAQVQSWQEALADSALDRMAENARELGLMPLRGGDYEPVQEQIAGFDVVLDKGMPSNTMKFVQPAPYVASQLVQQSRSDVEPVAWMKEGWGPDCGPYIEFYRDDEMGWRDRKEWTPLYTAPPAQPASEEDMKVYRAIADNYRKDLAAAQQAPTVQEPVAWVVEDEHGERLEWAGDVHSCHGLATLPLYTTPPNVATPLAAQRQWVGLTRSECLQIEKDMMKYYDYQHECKTVCLPEFARAIEAKLKEKNT
jgi:hypothetical protein